MVASCRPAIEVVEPKLYQINPENTRELITYLSSDQLNGRKTGTPGIDYAANFIEDNFRKNGLTPLFESYRDSFKLNTIDAFNVVGFVEGQDAILKNEIIIIGAHYDHVGILKSVNNDSIANGANDNAAGTVAVMQLAHYFASAKTNKRSLIFALFSAEEMGLQGSKHLAAKLKSTEIDLYTMLNFEMIGVPLVDKGYDAYLTGYEMSNMAGKMNAYMADNVIGFFPKSQEFKLFRRSDNFAFFKEFGLPCQTISTFDFTNYEYYHHVDDEASLMDFEHMSDLINKMIPAIKTMSVTPTKEIKMTKRE